MNYNLLLGRAVDKQTCIYRQLLNYSKFIEHGNMFLKKYALNVFLSTVQQSISF
jgi:hypothetical protein